MTRGITASAGKRRDSFWVTSGGREGPCPDLPQPRDQAGVTRLAADTSQSERKGREGGRRVSTVVKGTEVTGGRTPTETDPRPVMKASLPDASLTLGRWRQRAGQRAGKPRAEGPSPRPRPDGDSVGRHALQELSPANLLGQCPASRARPRDSADRRRRGQGLPRRRALCPPRGAQPG